MTKGLSRYEGPRALPARALAGRTLQNITRETPQVGEPEVKSNVPTVGQPAEALFGTKPRENRRAQR